MGANASNLLLVFGSTAYARKVTQRVDQVLTLTSSMKSMNHVVLIQIWLNVSSAANTKQKDESKHEDADESVTENIVCLFY